MNTEDNFRTMQSALETHHLLRVMGMSDSEIEGLEIAARGYGVDLSTYCKNSLIIYTLGVADNPHILGERTCEEISKRLTYPE